MVVTLAGVAAVGVVTAVPHLEAGASAAERGRDALLAGEFGDAADAFADAGTAFQDAEYLLAGLARPLFALPVVGPNVRAAAAVADAGGLAARGARDVADAVDGLPGGTAGLAPRRGAVPLAAMPALTGPLAGARERFSRGGVLLADVRSPSLWGPVDVARGELARAVAVGERTATVGAALSSALPDFLGADGRRRYLFVAQNLAESRGTGGFVGAVAEMRAQGGELSLGRFVDVNDLESVPADAIEPPNPDYAARYDRFGGAGFWLNINLTPDFPSAAIAMERLYGETTGRRVDGVISADPEALRALAEVGGPVEVAGVGEVAPDEIVDLLSNEAYGLIEDPGQRKLLLGNVAKAVLDRFLSDGGAGGREPVTALEALGSAAAQGHLLLHSSVASEQESFDTAGVSGRLLDEPGDYLAVVVNSGSFGKHDYYTDRAVRHRVALFEGGLAQAEVRTTFANETPTSGLPSRVIGPNADGLEAGEHRFVVSAFGPAGAELTGWERSRGRRDLVTESELGHPVFTTGMDLPSGEQGALTMSWEAPAVWRARQGVGTYTLTVQGRPAARPVELEVEITAPPGTVVREAGPDLERVDDRTVVFTGTEAPTRRFTVTFVAEPPSDFVGRVRAFLSRPAFGG